MEDGSVEGGAVVVKVHVAAAVVARVAADDDSSVGPTTPGGVTVPVAGASWAPARAECHGSGARCLPALPPPASGLPVSFPLRGLKR